MKIKKGKEKEYKYGYTINSNGYGRACYTFAERWAGMMEEAISKGDKLQDIAEDLSHKADEEGITGFMYGAAVSILSN